MEEHRQKREIATLDGTCMLVSDSNEINEQLDSKKLEYATLVELAQKDLFKKYLDMSKYLTNNSFQLQKETLNDKYKELYSLYAKYAGSNTPKFRVVDGQVILIEASKVPSNTSPEQYVRDKWNIPQNYQLNRIQDCMLRGESTIVGDNSNIQRQNNEKVYLGKENMPAHMHHSSIANNPNFTTIKTQEGTSFVNNDNTTYDVFFNDTQIGLDKNELDGTIGDFEVNPQGETTIAHDNMPNYHTFYGFVVRNPSE